MAGALSRDTLHSKVPRFHPTQLPVAGPQPTRTIDNEPICLIEILPPDYPLITARLMTRLKSGSSRPVAELRLQYKGTRTCVQNLIRNQTLSNGAFTTSPLLLIWVSGIYIRSTCPLALRAFRCFDRFVTHPFRTGTRAA